MTLKRCCQTFIVIPHVFLLLNPILAMVVKGLFYIFVLDDNKVLCAYHSTCYGLIFLFQGWFHIQHVDYVSINY